MRIALPPQLPPLIPELEPGQFGNTKVQPPEVEVFTVEASETEYPHESKIMHQFLNYMQPPFHVNQESPPGSSLTFTTKSDPDRPNADNIFMKTEEEITGGGWFSWRRTMKSAHVKDFEKIKAEQDIPTAQPIMPQVKNGHVGWTRPPVQPRSDEHTPSDRQLKNKAILRPTPLPIDPTIAKQYGASRFTKRTVTSTSAAYVSRQKYEVFLSTYTPSANSHENDHGGSPVTASMRAKLPNILSEAKSSSRSKHISSTLWEYAQSPNSAETCVAPNRDSPKGSIAGDVDKAASINPSEAFTTIENVEGSSITHHYADSNLVSQSEPRMNAPDSIKETAVQSDPIRKGDRMDQPCHMHTRTKELDNTSPHQIRA